MVGDPIDPHTPGALALFLCNSLNWRLSSSCEDILDLKELAEFAVATGQFTLSSADRMSLDQSAGPPVHALLAELRQARALVVSFLSLVAAGEKMDFSLHQEISAKWKDASRLMTLDEYGYVSIQAGGLTDLPLLALLSAVHLSNAQSSGKLKICEDARGCGFFFVDRTKNLSKRFCCSSCSTYDRQVRFRQFRLDVKGRGLSSTNLQESRTRQSGKA